MKKFRKCTFSDGSDTVHSGVFHRWADVKGRFSSARVVGIVEDETGQVHMIKPTEIKFSVASNKSTKAASPKVNLWQSAILLPGLHTHHEALNNCPAGYRLPSKEEFEQLADDAEYSFDDGFGVFKFKDGFALRLPAAGICDDDASLNDVGSGGFYWSSTVNGNNSYYLYFYSTSVFTAYYYVRSYGFSVIYVKSEQV